MVWEIVTFGGSRRLLCVVHDLLVLPSISFFVSLFLLLSLSLSLSLPLFLSLSLYLFRSFSLSLSPCVCFFSLSLSLCLSLSLLPLFLFLFPSLWLCVIFSLHKSEYKVYKIQSCFCLLTLCLSLTSLTVKEIERCLGQTQVESLIGLLHMQKQTLVSWSYLIEDRSRT